MMPRRVAWGAGLLLCACAKVNVVPLGDLPDSPGAANGTSASMARARGDVASLSDSEPGMTGKADNGSQAPAGVSASDAARVLVSDGGPMSEIMRDAEAELDASADDDDDDDNDDETDEAQDESDAGWPDAGDDGADGDDG